MVLPFEDPPADQSASDLWTRFLAWLGEAGGNVLQIAIIIVVCLISAFLLRFIIRRVVRRIVTGAKNKANVEDTQALALDQSPLAAVRVIQRTRTLGTILQGIGSVTIFFIAMILIVQVLNENILGSLTLLTAAVGAGLGFGAQNIVRDVLNGIFIVAGDQLGIGDVVDLGLATGVVENVSVRVTHVRDVNGTLWYVRNGEILRIGNMSMGWSRVIVDLSVGMDADVDAVEKTMMDVATALMKDPKWRSRIVERPEMWGLDSVGSDMQVLRIVMRTRANAKDDVAQELRARLKAAMDEQGVVVPALATVNLEGPIGAQRVRGANPPKTRPTPVASAPAQKKQGPRWMPRKSSHLPETPPDAVPAPTEERPITKPTPTKPAKPRKTEKPEPQAERHDPPQDGTP